MPSQAIHNWEHIGWENYHALQAASQEPGEDIAIVCSVLRSNHLNHFAMILAGCTKEDLRPKLLCVSHENLYVSPCMK